MKTFSRIFPLLAALSLCSCMTFERDWEKAVAEYEDGKVSSPEGPWIGSWITTSNGHEGGLRAIVNESESRPGEYDFRYHATWAKILSGSYTVAFPARRSGSRYLVDGKKSLGPFGTFGHRATITRDSFEATYSNDRDELGEFHMARPE